MENIPKIALICGGDNIIRHLTQVLIDAEASNNIIVVETKEEAREVSMFYQPWTQAMRMESRYLRGYEDFRTMMSDGQDGAFAQSGFVNELALKQAKKNRKNNNRVQFKNEAYKFYNRKRSR